MANDLDSPPFPWHASPQDVGQQLSVTEQTVKWYLKMLEVTGDVKPCSHTSSIQQIRATDTAKADSSTTLSCLVWMSVFLQFVQL